ncbi:VTT domain-containing protein [Eubacteriaceae bacterium ES3]|nr:VTT domain-containing protein [Eubacteriaceae bacterium ES3]
MNIKAYDKLIKIIIFLMLATLLIFIIDLYSKGIFASTQSFENYIKSFGPWEALVFIGFQMIMVIFPFMPSSIGTVVGIILFGPILGFVYNYIAICTASVIDFFLSRKYGVELVKKMVSQKTLDKYFNVLSDQKRFEKIFAGAIFLPGAPDDYLCYLAGLSTMKFSHYFIIILLGKIPSIAVFSLGITSLFHFLLSLFTG